VRPLPVLAGIGILTLSGSARADVALPPQDCSGQPGCAAPVADGVIGADEYIDGRAIPMSDFGAGGADGTLRLLLAGETLHIAARVHDAGRPDPSGVVEVYFDAKRPDTLGGLPDTWMPLSDDRRITVRYDLAPRGSTSVIERKGQAGAWVGFDPWTFPAMWPHTWGITRPTSDPGFIHVELAVQLRPVVAPQSEPVASGMVGLGVHHESSTDGSLEHFPGDVQFPPDESSTWTWETLVFADPDPVPLSVSMYNLFLDDEAVRDSAGEPEDFANVLWDREIVCINDVWDAGDQDELVETIDKIRADKGLGPMYAAGLDYQVQDVIPDWKVDSDWESGLLILSSRPIVEFGVHDFQTDVCLGDDSCGYDGGVLWARILTAAAEPASQGEQVVWDADQFVDVYCTHLRQSYLDLDPGQANHQAVTTREFIEATRSPDRPAILMGGMLVDPPQMPVSYEQLKKDLGVAELTPFDQANSWLSDVYDLGTLDPVGTYMDGWCDEDTELELAGMPRTDYIFVIPASTPWPDFGVAADPGYSVDIHHEPDVDEHDCLSYHAELRANIGLVPTSEPGHWNPTVDHAVTYTITQIIDHASGGCCADWFTPFLGLLDVSKAYGESESWEGDVVYPGWSVSRTMSQSGVAFMELQLWEGDTSDDHYDATPGTDGLDPKFSFDHASGKWRRLSDAYGDLEVLGSFEDFPGGMIVETTGKSGETATVFHRLTAPEL
jgi:hypothetical protein